MAAGQFTLSDKAIQDLGNLIDWVGTSITAVLVDVSHTPDVTESVFSDISANEVDSGVFPNYSQQGLASKILWKTDPTELRYTSDAVIFGSSVTISARYLYFVEGTISALTPTDTIVGYCDLDEELGAAENVKSINSTFLVNPSSTGWFKRIRG